MKRSNGGILISDAVFEDLLNDAGSDWEKRLGNLRFLAETPDLVFVSGPLQRHIDSEVLTGRAMRVVPDDQYTQDCRLILRALTDESIRIEDVVRTDQIEAAIDRHNNKQDSVYSDFLKIRERLRESWKIHFSEQTSKALLNSDEDELVRQLADYLVYVSLRPLVNTSTCPEFPRLFFSNSVIVRLMGLTVLLTLEDIAEGRTQIPRHKSRNTMIDQDHAIVGSFTKRFHCADKPAKKRCDLLKRAMERGMSSYSSIASEIRAKHWS
ncbi:hypothetical protein OAU50_01470 [Planctomycetota bacterium]|nr:hypothetical protein [Planctomycetota bacterium]